MGRVTTNSLQLAVAVEENPGVLPNEPIWNLLQPNAITTFGDTFTKVTSSPISKARQRRKGINSDKDSAVEFDSDLTLSTLRDMIQGFAFARVVGPFAVRPSASAAGGYTVPALSSTQADQIQFGAGAATSLVFARGFKKPENNGIKLVSADVADGAVLIPVAGNLAEAVSTGTDAEVAICGVRAAAGDLEIDANGDLVSTALDFSTLGLTGGQFIHIGGIDITNRFFSESNYGFARIDIIEANKLVLAKRTQDFVVDDGSIDNNGGAGVSVDLLFGQYVRNVDTDHEDYLETNFQFELESPNLGPNGEDMFEYALGSWSDAISLNIPLTEKATMSLGFMSLKTTEPTAARAPNSADALFPSETGAFSTSSDIARLRIEDEDENGITTDFKSLTITMTNNVAGEKVLGRLGAAWFNNGNFEADIEAELLFTSPRVITSIKNNDEVGLDFGIRNDDGGAYFDYPSATMNGGNRSFPENASVTIQTTIEVFRDELHGHSFSCSFFPVLPENEELD